MLSFTLPHSTYRILTDWINLLKTIFLAESSPARVSVPLLHLSIVFPTRIDGHWITNERMQGPPIHCCRCVAPNFATFLSPFLLSPEPHVKSYRYHWARQWSKAKDQRHSFLIFKLITYFFNSNHIWQTMTTVAFEKEGYAIISYIVMVHLELKLY